MRDISAVCWSDFYICGALDQRECCRRGDKSSTAGSATECASACVKQIAILTAAAIAQTARTEIFRNTDLEQRDCAASKEAHWFLSTFVLRKFAHTTRHFDLTIQEDDARRHDLF